MDQRDATGLSYRRNRYYDPVSGQFTQSDPIGIAGGLNLYGYANGDPINFSDPFGLKGCDDDDEGEPCPVFFFGIQGSAAFGVGPVGALGVTVDDDGAGLYGRVGIHFGLNQSIGTETGIVGADALSGASLEMCAGIGSGDACAVFASDAERELTGGLAGGPSLSSTPVTVNAGGSIGGRLSFGRLMNGLRKIFTPPDCPPRLQPCAG
jgi:RHS repeat-associated protein